MEFLWQPFKEDLGSSKQIMTHVLYNHYSSPPGFNDDVLGNDDPITSSNADSKIDQFLSYVEIVRKAYRSNHIFMPMGDDFQYQDASMNFKNMDKLIELFNDKHGDSYEVLYSTPSTYVDAIKEAKVQWPVYSGDLFPYADNKDSYWTGYFTSRPNAKA